MILSSSIPFMIYFIALGIVPMFLGRNKSERNFLITFCWLAFLLRTIFAIGAFHFFRFDDEYSYDAVGQLIASSFLEGEGFFVYPTTNPFYYMSAVNYIIFGLNPLTVRIFNSFLGTLLSLVIYMLAKNIFSDSRVSKYSFLLSIIYSDLIVKAGSQLKDISVTLLIALFVLSMVSSWSLSRKTIVMIFCWVSIYYFRYGLAIFLLVTFLSYLIVKKIGERRYIKGLVIVCFILIFFSFIYFAHPQIISSVFLTLDQKYISHPNYVGSFEPSGTLVRRYMGYNPFSLSNYIISFLRYLAIPLPIYFFVKQDFISILDSLSGLFWYFILPFWITGFFISLKNPKAFIVHILSVGLFLITAHPLLAISGEPLRYRVPMLPFFILLFAVGYSEYKNNLLIKKKIKRFWLIEFIAVLFIFWFYLKHWL